MTRVFHLAAFFGLSLGIVACSSLRDREELPRYLPYSRGVLSGDFEGFVKNLADKFPESAARWNEFESVKSLLDHLFDGDTCYLNVGTDTILIRAVGRRQATVYVNCSPLPGSAEWMGQLFSGKHSDHLPTQTKMLSDIELTQVVKIEWYDASSSGVFVPPSPSSSCP